MTDVLDSVRRVLQRLSGGSTPAPDTVGEQESSADRTSYPPVVVANGVCEATCNALRSHSPLGEHHEGITYWAGIHLSESVLQTATCTPGDGTTDSSGCLFVTTCITPEAMTSPGNFSVSTISNSRVTEAINEYGLEMFGTVHSHPGTRTDHSGTDDDGAFLPFDGYYSVVVPDYAQHGMDPLSDCGVHRYEERIGGFRSFTATEIDDTFTVLSVPTAIDTRP